MNTKRVTGGSKWSRSYIDVVGAALIATVTMACAATPPADDKPQGADLSEADMADASPADITRDWIARRHLGEVVAKMPSGWLATEATRQAAEEPLGDAVDRARWRRDAELMPSGWPATEAMRQAAARDGVTPAQNA